MKFSKFRWKNQKNIANPTAFDEGVISRFQQTAIVGMWRMGNPDAVIANITNVPHTMVFAVIKIYDESTAPSIE